MKKIVGVYYSKEYVTSKKEKSERIILRLSSCYFAEILEFLKSHYFTYFSNCFACAFTCFFCPFGYYFV